MKSEKMIKAGWILSILLGLLFTFSSSLKLSQNEAGLAQADSLGIDYHTFFLIGVLELVSLILFLVPRTGLIGGLLLIAYMGGAIAVHLQQGQPISVAVLVEALIWVSLALRYPETYRNNRSGSEGQVSRL